MTTAAPHPKALGDQAEAHVLAALVERFKTVLLPSGFNAFSSTYHHPSNRGVEHYTQGYAGDADLFAVWCPETRGVYLIPVEEVGESAVALRVDPPKNNQRARIRFAADYEVHPPE